MKSHKRIKYQTNTNNTYEKRFSKFISLNENGSEYFKCILKNTLGLKTEEQTYLKDLQLKKYINKFILRRG